MLFNEDKLAILAVEIQTPHWPPSCKASSTDFEARPRTIIAITFRLNTRILGTNTLPISKMRNDNEEGIGWYVDLCS